MAWTKSGLYITAFVDMLTLVALTGAGTLFTNTSSKIALHSNALTDGTAPINFSAATITWANTSEVSGTGWAAGGVLLSAAATGATSTAPTVAEGTAGAVRYDMNDVAVSGTTLTAARGCIIYCDPITLPSAMAKAMLIAVTFGADYSTSAGIFGIQWSVTGLCEIDITP
jgi:hypothetical protein